MQFDLSKTNCSKKAKILHVESVQTGQILPRMERPCRWLTRSDSDEKIDFRNPYKLSIVSSEFKHPPFADSSLASRAPDCGWNRVQRLGLMEG